MPRKIGHSKKHFAGATFALGRGGRYWGWANAGRGKSIVDLADFVWFKHNGALPPGERLIHIDGDVANCQIRNLRIAGASPDAAPKPAKKAKNQATKKADK